VTDLMQRQLHDVIVRSLKETGRRMAAKYRGVSADRPVVQKAGGRQRGKAAGSKSVGLRGRG